MLYIYYTTLYYVLLTLPELVDLIAAVGLIVCFHQSSHPYKLQLKSTVKD